MDWNWLYSSLSQSIAAIVGLIGSFIITKIISNQAIYKVNNDKLSEFILNSKSLKEKINNRYFTWYNNNIRKREFEELNDNLEKNGIKKSSLEYYNSLKFSLFDDRVEILHEIDSRIKNYKKTQEKKAMFGSLIPTSFPHLSMLNTNEINEEKESINNLIIEISQNIQLINNFINEIKINPQSSILIFWSIIIILILFYIGVIFPLCLLPVDNNNPNILNYQSMLSIKGVILLFVTLLFSLIMTIFMITNIMIKYKKEDIDKLKVYSDLGNYSKFLKIYEINKKYFSELKKNE